MSGFLFPAESTDQQNPEILGTENPESMNQTTEYRNKKSPNMEYLEHSQFPERGECFLPNREGRQKLL